MASKPKFLTIQLADIDVSDRVQPLDEAKAQEIATSFGAHGQLINRIGLRQTPNGAKGWALVHGRHRLRALEISGLTELVGGVHFDRLAIEPAQARLMEIEENMARTDVSPFGRAVMLVAYRAAIGLDANHGGDRRSGAFQSIKSDGLRIDDQRSDELKARTHAASGQLAAGFVSHAMAVFDLGKNDVERLLRIGTHLTAPAGLAERIHSSRIARNQSQLLKLAALAPENLERAAEAFDAAKGDFYNLMAILSQAPARQATMLQEIEVGAGLDTVVATAKPLTTPAFDYHKQAISSFSQLSHKNRVSAAREFWKRDKEAIRKALHYLGWSLVKIEKSEGGQ